jgi:hypothetical protein
MWVRNEMMGDDNDSSVRAVSFQRLNKRGLYNNGHMPQASNPQFPPAGFPHSSSTLTCPNTMGLAGVLSVFVVKKHEKPWEVVDSKTVEPVPLFDEDEGALL